jgi:formamidopyrimidine-DNA glycosylase
MFELPELVTLASQINSALSGRTIRAGSLGNRPHKFVWYNRSPEEFTRLTAGKQVGPARARGKWLFVPLEAGYVLLFGECGGKMLLHAPGARLPDAWHLRLDFDDDSVLTVTTAMWGAMELHEAGRELDRQYVRGMRPTPVDAEFTFGYFSGLIDGLLAGEKRSVKGLLTQDQLIPGLGNAIAQDILFRARLHPRRALADVSAAERQVLHAAITTTIGEAVALGGRNDETDLFGDAGRYVRRMDKAAAGRPCPECGMIVQKIQYLGGACYFCPACQP